MSGYIKYFDNGGKNMSFMIKDDSILVKYNETWNKIKKTLNIKFHSMPVYDEKYIKAKAKGTHYTCIACISIDSVTKIEKKNFLQVYLEECKYKIKKKKMSKFTDVELESDSSSDSK